MYNMHACMRQHYTRTDRFFLVFVPFSLTFSRTSTADASFPFIKAATRINLQLRKILFGCSKSTESINRRCSQKHEYYALYIDDDIYIYIYKCIYTTHITISVQCVYIFVQGFVLLFTQPNIWSPWRKIWLFINSSIHHQHWLNFIKFIYKKEHLRDRNAKCCESFLTEWITISLPSDGFVLRGSGYWYFVGKTAPANSNTMEIPVTDTATQQHTRRICTEVEISKW